MAFKERIDWDVHENLLIRDIHRKWYDRVVEFMKEKYFRPNVLYKQVDLFDDENAESHYELFLRHCLRNECSVMAITNGNDEKQLKAVAILKWNTEEYRMWSALRVLLPEGKMNKFIQLQCKLIDEYSKNNPDHDFIKSGSLHLFEYFICEDIKTPEFLFKFFNAIKETARHMKMPCVTYLALSDAERKCMEQFYDFTEVTSIIYSLYRLDGELVFYKLRFIDEMSAVLYECPVLPLTPFALMPPTPVKLSTLHLTPSRISEKSHLRGTSNIKLNSNLTILDK